MDDDFPLPAAPTVPAAPTTLDRGGGQKPAPFRWRFPAQHLPRPIETPIDVSSVLGLPLGSIPKPVQEAVARLAGEVERLRGELEHALGHLAWLEEMSDLHPLLPVLNRRAFMRQLGHVMERSSQAGLPGTLLYLHVGGLERLRTVHGLAAGEAALHHVAELLKGALRQIDLVAYFDGGDFVIALALAEEEGAEDKARRIATAVESQPFAWEGHHFAFTVSWGLAPFRPAENAEAVLAEADGARRGVPQPS